jgi:hypothetical protein
MEKEKYGKA